MATIPTISQLYSDILTDLENKLSVSIPLFGKSVLRALAAVQAGKLKLYYLLLGNIQKNIFVDTADPESIGGTLERFGRVKLGRDPFPATEGEYTLTVTGNIGGVISANTTFKSDDDSTSPGKLFVIDNDYTLVSSPDTITVRALESGLDSRLSVADGLTSTEPIANVDSEAVVASEDVIPLAAEELEDYRRKAIEAYQTETQGGAGGDYRIWAADVQGVQRVYPYVKSGIDNEIDLYVEATESDSVDGKGTPTAAILSEVEEVVEFDPDTTKPLTSRGRRPLTVNLIDVQAVSVKDVDIEIVGFSPTPSATKQTAIEEALKAIIDDVRPFVASTDIIADRNDYLKVNRLIAAVEAVIDVTDSYTSLNLEVDTVSIPSQIQFEDGDIPYINSVSFT